MADPDPTICLALVVRDEGKIISRCLDSVKNLVDSWVIVDTGSHDDTLEKAAATLHPLQGRIISAAWNGYAHHRNQAFEAAAAQADWVLVLDADETLRESEPDVKRRLNKNAALIEIRAAFHSRMQPRLIHQSFDGRYRGAIIDRLDVPVSAVTHSTLDGWTIVHHGDGYRARSPERRLQEARRLISSSTDRHDDDALLCDIADLCFDLGDWQTAHSYYRQCVDLHSGGDREWYACYRAARALEMMAARFDDVIGLYHHAFECRPERAETLYRMAALARRNGRLAEAFDLAGMAVETPLTCRGLYFERPVYEYLARIEWARCFLDRGDRDTARALFDMIGALPALPDDWRRWIGNALARLASRAVDTPNDRSAKPLPPSPPPPTPTPIGKPKRMTIGMATYDDFDGVFFTAMAIRMYHPEVTEETEILVIDNHPAGRCSEALKALDKRIIGYRYLPVDDTHGTAVRDRLFTEANAPSILCLDSHVLIDKGAVRRLIDYFSEHPDCRDVLQGPLCREDGSPYATHMEPVWRQGFLGTWSVDARGAEPDLPPFEIPLQGLGLFACRREAWPGFNPRFLGFGGEEGYLHEKARLAGSKIICLPFLRWLHRFSRPEGPRYLISWEDRIRNYLIGFEELGLDPTPVKRHFSDLLGEEQADRIFVDIEKELQSPFHFFDAIYCINLDDRPDRWEEMRLRFESLGIARRVRRFRAVSNPRNHHIGCALSHRGIIETADRQRLHNVLILEDDAVFLDDIRPCLSRSLAELRERPWKIFYLGGCRWGTGTDAVEGCRYLKRATRISCTHAVAVNRSVFGEILTKVPADLEGMEDFIRTHRGIDQWIPRNVDELYIASPPVASQPSILSREDPSLGRRFTI